MDIETIIASNPELAQTLPMPHTWYKKYNIPPPQPLSFKEALMSVKWSNGAGTEITEPAPGGVREVPKSEPLEITLLTEDNSNDKKENETVVVQ